jgi:hypothetical protein
MLKSFNISHTMNPEIVDLNVKRTSKLSRNSILHNQSINSRHQESIISEDNPTTIVLNHLTSEKLSSSNYDSNNYRTPQTKL